MFAKPLHRLNRERVPGRGRCRVRQSYFKNAALLTGSDVVLRLAGMGLRIWLANALGGAGMGLYQLVLAVYGLFVTLATAASRWPLPGC